MESPRFVLRGSDPGASTLDLVQIELDGKIVDNCLEACPGEQGWIAHIALTDAEGCLQPVKISGKVRVLVQGVAVHSKVEYAQQVNRVLGLGAFRMEFWPEQSTGSREASDVPD